MARTKHNRTKNGTHRERVFKARQTVELAKKMAQLPDDGLGHSLQDSSLAHTLKELDGMISHDRHEQLMDTFVEQEDKTNE